MIPDAYRNLMVLVDTMNADELRVLAKFAGKIVAGSRTHGPMDLINDTRDWQREQLEERIDDVCYGLMREVQAELRVEARVGKGLAE